QLFLDEEALRETLEEEAMAEKELEERIKQEQSHDELFRLEFKVVTRGINTLELELDVAVMSAADDVISHDMNGCSSVMNSVLVINLNTSNGNDGLETGLIYYSLFRLVCFNNNHELTYLAISSKVVTRGINTLKLDVAVM
ncbi:hypothetical protein Tco_0748281, partial [Tanacetum coccineum]